MRRAPVTCTAGFPGVSNAGRILPRCITAGITLIKRREVGHASELTRRCRRGAWRVDQNGKHRATSSDQA
eukprot:CAMPEP_0179314224 /NCGR_PEP_ID=MMETSP0797-20121207/54295_1 /TAXON_ID=47934 /ORGANISM="Dinophysis acuminata, Strain DAEP01" /LENGTH=69 /DNA_ID=CAMNT_0021024429 /DNA_START=136 /DNA_END=345 /DNA_ORIENTATION=-